MTKIKKTPSIILITLLLLALTGNTVFANTEDEAIFTSIEDDTALANTEDDTVLANPEDDTRFASPEREPRNTIGTYGTSNWNIDSAGVLRIGTGTFPDRTPTASAPSWASYGYMINHIVFEGNVTALGSQQLLFSNLLAVRSIENLHRLDTSAVTNMSGMFNNLISLQHLDISTFDTRNVTNVERMFYNLASLSTLNAANFDASSLNSTTDMFHHLPTLTTLNVSNFNAANVDTTARMFYSLPSLRTFNLSNFNTSGVSNMEQMFYGLQSLTELDLSSFDTSSVTNMREMFCGFHGLQHLNIANFDTGNIATMQNMFRDLYDLHVLVLGKDFSFHANAGLSTAPNLAPHMRHWQNVGSGTIAQPAGGYVLTTQELINLYTGTMADIYVRVEATTSIIPEPESEPEPDITNTTLDISKTVVGKYGAYHKAFEVRVSLKDNQGNAVNGAYPVSSSLAEVDDYIVTFIDGEALVYIRHNETISLQELPIGYQYTVIEIDTIVTASESLYTVTYNEVTSETGISGVLGEETAIVAIINLHEAIPDTGINENNTTLLTNSILILLAFLIAMMRYFDKKRRYR
jgi:bacterial surface protein 26-residue repeat